MDSFNYNHLFYFWAVARNGSVSKASAELRVSQPTVSEQIGKLEEALGVALFERAGRGIRLNHAGQKLFGYAEQIFRLGQEMREVVQGDVSMATRLAIGVAQTIPNALAIRMLSPVLREQNLRLSCTQDRTDNLLGRLALRQLDLVLTDTPEPSMANVRLFSQKIGMSGLSFLASPKLRLRGNFPQVLEGAPMLMPEANTTLHDALQNWFKKSHVSPKIVGEVSGSGMVESLGREGLGVFVVPTIVEREIQAQVKLSVLGRSTDMKQEFYAVTAEKRATNSLVMAILGPKQTYVRS
jgi:LysR family transcriptional activator of nhaA